MNRREFLKAALITAAAGIVPVEFLKGIPRPDPPPPVLRHTHYRALQGGPFRKSCDGLSSYDHIPVATVWQDIIHHRLPPLWRDRMVLGLNGAAGDS